MDSKFYKISLEIIDRVKFLIEMGDYDEIKEYLNKKEEMIKIMKQQEIDESSNYIDKLIKDLK